ncbi:MAG: sugar phosphate isomerase/epimerase [Gemmatimonadetes bacterium]|nr:TIM barrel protein [Gemmatimonadota bacterium]MYJ69081.1 sugar phosphate isomerase/epimerase [Gemmatimonadota bacterium]
MDRKDFLRVAGLGVLAGCARGDAPAAGDGGRAGLEPPLDVIGVQLYTVRALMSEDVAGTLDAVAAIGYREVEFAGYFGHSPNEVRQWLDAAGLTSPATHVGIPELTGTGLEASMETAHTLGQRWLVLPSLPGDMQTADGYREAAEILNTAGAAAGEADLRIGYHNHAFEFDTVGEDGETGYDLLLQHLDPSLVDLEIDFHWTAAGGVDSAALLRDNPGRFPLCHLKDMSTDGRMADVGAGVIDWAAIFALSETAGLRHYFVEHDQPADPLASIEASYRYLSAS